MTPADFIAKWRNVELKERSASQSHFNDLCRLLGVEDPVTADRVGEWFTFEKGASKTGGGEGWADVWRKECFAWEYKGKRKDLDAAFAQLQRYAIALDNPPLLIVSDMDRIRIHTNWTNTVQKVHVLSLDDLGDAATRDLLRNCFLKPEALKPGKTRQALTEEAATHFASVAERLRRRNHDPQKVAHFVNQLVFCMFAEDVELLPNRLFENMIRSSRGAQGERDFPKRAANLFRAMREGGLYGNDAIDVFNGGLFANDETLPLTYQDLDDLYRITAMDWSDIDPSIFGTLFERGLDPDKRSQLGAHYTDRDKIMMIVNPVIVEPLLAEWAGVKAKIEGMLQNPDGTRREADDGAKAKANALRQAFSDRLHAFRVLDPACGSGNFLYLALLELKNIEHRMNLDAEALGLERQSPRVGPENLLGIELNPYAAELARVSVWIGEIQWMRRNGYEAARNPILRKLDTIECRDAVLAPDGTRAAWPVADVVVGNPPFVGNKKMIASMGEAYTVALRNAFPEIPSSVDLVAYWFAKTWAEMQEGNLIRAGLVATNSIRGGANREVLKPIANDGQIFLAWSDEDWTLDGAAVRVSMICFRAERAGSSLLDNSSVPEIFADLTANIGVDLTLAFKLATNVCAYIGDQKTGKFDMDGTLARSMIALPTNINGLKNEMVVRPWMNGMDVVRRPSDSWIVDFGSNLPLEEAMLFEEPFRFVASHVQDFRSCNRNPVLARRWWIHEKARQDMRDALFGFERYIITSRVSKHRLFRWTHASVLPDSATVAIARDDDTTFGILHSRFHELWALRMGTSLEDRPRYTPSTTFETFPFPEGLTPDIPASAYAGDPRAVAIAAAAARLNELRENWLNPPDLIRRVPEVVPGYPDRILPVDEAAARVLKTRTLTNLYNQRPAWLSHAHAALDLAVAGAYGWGADWASGMGDDDILARLFRLNQTRAGRGGGG